MGVNAKVDVNQPPETEPLVRQLTSGVQNPNHYRNIYPSTMTGIHRVKSLFFRHWTGSIFKLIWTQVLKYVVLFYGLSLLYRFYLIPHSPPELRKCFEKFCVYCETFDRPAAVTILTGFYVTNVVARWWNQFMSLPWPDQVALKLVAFLPGNVSYNFKIQEA